MIPQLRLFYAHLRMDTREETVALSSKSIIRYDTHTGLNLRWSFRSLRKYTSDYNLLTHRISLSLSSATFKPPNSAVRSSTPFLEDFRVLASLRALRARDYNQSGSSATKLYNNLKDSLPSKYAALPIDGLRGPSESPVSLVLEVHR